MNILVVSMMLFVAGLVFGSFLNVCIFRLPRGESIAFPPSQCVKCGNRLGVLELFPVISFILLKGKCAHCGEKISIKYPLVELLTGLIFVALFLKFGFSASLAFFLVIGSLLILIIFTDLETQIIPDSANVIFVVTGLLYGIYRGSFCDSLAGVLGGFFIMYGIFRLGTAVYKKEAMGGGDIKLATGFGALFGLQDLILALFLSFIIGAVIAVFYLVYNNKGRHQEIPFGPSMALAAFIVIFFGKALWRWYLGF